MNLSKFINQKDVMKNRDEYTLEYIEGAYVKVYKPYLCGYPNCGKRFKLSTELEEHLQCHMKNVNLNKAS